MIKKVKYAIIAIIALLAFCCLCVILSIIGVQAGIIPNTAATKTQSAKHANATATIIALTPSSTPSPSHTPTDTSTPSNTPPPTLTYTPSNTPLPTNTPTITPPPSLTNSPTITPLPTLNLLERNIYKVPAVSAIRSNNISKTNDAVLVYIEADVYPSQNNENTARELYTQAYAVAIFTYGSNNIGMFHFSSILWDGIGAPTDWTFNPQTDQWQATPLSTAPESTLIPQSSALPTSTNAPSANSANSTSIQPASGTRYVSSAGALNIRAEPNTNAAVLGQLQRGDEITLTGRSGDWYRIQYGTTQAWVSASLTSSSPPPTAAPAQPNASAPALAGCVCTHNAYNCPDFPSRSAAQACFDKCWSEVGFDIHGLDGDGNRLACERN